MGVVWCVTVGCGSLRQTHARSRLENFCYRSRTSFVRICGRPDAAEMNIMRVQYLSSPRPGWAIIHALCVREQLRLDVGRY